MDLQKLRGEIDAIDTQMTDLFVRRMGLCAEVARYKKENGMAVVHQGREREILSRISALAGDELDSYARILFSTLFDLSRSYQSMLITEASPVEGKIDEALRSTPQMLPKKAVVACQGVEGGYAQQACDKVFSFADIMYFRSWEGVFSAVQKGLCQYGILPIENSSNGSVNGVYDLMRSFDFHIVRGVKLHVNHSLLACPGADLGGIKEIFSHEQAIGQCSEFLKTLPGVQITVCENTAMAAKLVAESGRTDAAAISSPACAAMYGLRELRQGVHPDCQEPGDLPRRGSSEPDVQGGPHPRLPDPCAGPVFGFGPQHDQAGVPSHLRRGLPLHVLHGLRGQHLRSQCAQAALRAGAGAGAVCVFGGVSGGVRFELGVRRCGVRLRRINFKSSRVSRTPLFLTPHA